jgi:hypothetical protein
LGKSGEIEKVNLVRKIVTTIDWPCKTRTLFSKYNLGCKIAVSHGIKWFFENEEEGIILEDDCLPHLDFFLFCEKLLEKYRNDERILTITGDNFRTTTFNGVAVGITPLVYIANLTQVGVADPTTDELVNSFSNITWTRAGVGEYYGLINDFAVGVILEAEISVIINNSRFDGIISARYEITSNEIYVTTSQIGVGFVDAYLNNTTLEIKYYQP